MQYQRPVNKTPLSKAEKLEMIEQYIDHYRALAASDLAVLNRKVPRDAFAELVDRVGDMLLSESLKLADAEGPVRAFLNANPLPPAMAQRLPDDFRVFCLVLNSLKQWIAAEQAATDRYLLGGGVRALCRESSQNCPVTGEPLGEDVELHHPVRDGRPPLPLSKNGHDLIEGQLSSVATDLIGQALCALRSQRNGSWAQLRRGCLDLLGRPVPWPSKASANSARSFARKAATATELSYEKIIEWMDQKGV